MAEPNTPPLPIDRPEMRVRPEPRPAPDLTVEDWARYYATIPTRAGLSLLNGLYKTSGSMAALLGLVDQKDVDAYYDDNIRRMKALEDKITSTRGSKFIAEESLIPQEVYGIIGEMASFAVPYLGLSKILTGGQILKPLAATVATDLFIGFGGLSPNDENLFNLLADLAPDSEAAVALESYLGTSPDDPEIVNRTRNAVEALLALGAAEGIIRGTIAAPEFLRKLKRTKDALPAEYAKAVEAVDKLPPGKSTDRLKAVIDPEGKPTAQQADPQSPYSSPKEAAEGPNNKQILADQSDGKTMSSVSVRRVEELADARTDEELVDVFRRDDGFVTPKMVDFDDDPFAPLDEDLPVEEAMAKAMGKPLPPSLKAAKFNMDEFVYADPKPGGSSSGAIYLHKPSGKKYLIKMYDNPDQAVNEVIANRFYTDAMQYNNVPRMDLVRDGDNVYLASEFIDDLVQSPTVPNFYDTHNDLGKIYPAAAFLQDNDVVGIDKSNIQFLASVKAFPMANSNIVNYNQNFVAIPIDHGGSLFFKATGAPKPYTADDSALTTYMDDAFDPASFFNNPPDQGYQDSFDMGAIEAFKKIEELDIPAFIDSLKKEGLAYQEHSLDYLQKTMQKRQSLFAQFAAKQGQLDLYKTDLDIMKEGLELTEDQKSALAKARLKATNPEAIPEQKKYEGPDYDDDDLVVDAQVSPNKEIKKFTQKAENLGYNSGFLVIRNDSFTGGSNQNLFQMNPPFKTAGVPESQLGSQLGRQILPEGATVSLGAGGSAFYGRTIYSGAFLNGNGFYKNMDGSSEFTLSEFRDGRLGYSLADNPSPKAFFQAGKSLAMDNPESFLGIDLPEEVDLTELNRLRNTLNIAASTQLPDSKIVSSVIDHILTNSYGAAPLGLVKTINQKVFSSNRQQILIDTHQKLTSAIKKDFSFKYPRMNYSGLHPQGYQEYKDVYSNKYAKFFGRPFEVDGEDAQISLGKANITPLSKQDWQQSESTYAEDISAVLKDLNKNAQSPRDAYISYPVIDEINGNYTNYTNSQNDRYSNLAPTTFYNELSGMKQLNEIIDLIDGGVLKLEKTGSIRIPNQSIAILSKDRTQEVLPAGVDPLGTNLKSVVLAEAASKTPKGTVPAPIDVPNSARLEEAETQDILSTPAIATGAAAALTAAQLVDEPEDAMDAQMRDLTRPREQVGREVPGLRTKYGRPVYETDEGMVSEQSVTLQVAPDEVINIPSIHDGVRYNRDELRDMYLRGDIQATSRHSDIESAVAAAQTRSDEAFSSVPFDPGTVDDPFDAERTDLFAGQTEDPPADDTGLRIEVRPRPEFEQTDELFNQQRGML